VCVASCLYDELSSRQPFFNIFLRQATAHQAWMSFVDSPQCRSQVGILNLYITRYEQSADSESQMSEATVNRSSLTEPRPPSFILSWFKRQCCIEKGFPNGRSFFWEFEWNGGHPSLESRVSRGLGQSWWGERKSFTFFGVKKSWLQSGKFEEKIIIKTRMKFWKCWWSRKMSMYVGKWKPLEKVKQKNR
jgi:hypothetical protein